MELISRKKTNLGSGVLNVYRQSGAMYPTYKLNGKASYGPEDQCGENWSIEGEFDQVVELWDCNGHQTRKWFVTKVGSEEVVCSGEN